MARKDHTTRCAECGAAVPAEFQNCKAVFEAVCSRFFNG
jgi:hypothetical protein